MKKTSILMTIIIALVCYSFAQTPAPQQPVPAIAEDNVTASTEDNVTESAGDNATGPTEEAVPVQAYTLNGVSVPMPVRFQTDSKNFTLTLTPVIGTPMQLHFQNRVDGWAVNGNIIGFTFDALALAVDFTEGQAYMLPDKAVEAVLKTLSAENTVSVTGISAPSGITVMLADAEAIPAADIRRDFALAESDPSTQPLISNGSVVAAAAKGDVEAISRLLNAGHNINETEITTGDNALFKAIKINDDALADLLIKAGINIGYMNGSRQTALHLAAARGQYSIVYALLSAGAEPNSRDASGNTPLIYAILNDNPDVTEILLQKGAMGNVSNDSGMSALALAAGVGDLAQVDLLLNYGVSDVDSALTEALRRGNIQIMERLLSRGADVNQTDSVGNTLLHNAVYMGNEALVRLLLAKGADINAQNADGQTPLMFAVMQRDERLVNLLLARFPNVYLTDKQDRSALDIAYSMDWYVVKLLEDGLRATQGLDNQLFDKVVAGDYATVRTLLEMGGAWTESENPVTGNTPLFIAVSNNDKDMAYLLLARGADPNKQNKQGNTPLMMAVQAADEQLFEMLLNAGARPDIQNTKGDTALIVASKLGKLNVARMLLLANANPNLHNYSGIRPLAVAQGEDARDVERMLRSFGAY